MSGRSSLLATITRHATAVTCSRRRGGACNRIGIRLWTEEPFTSGFLQAPRTHAPRTHAPRTHAARTHAPRTHAPCTHAPRTHAPRTHAPRTHAPRTHAPSTGARPIQLQVPPRLQQGKRCVQEGEEAQGGGEEGRRGACARIDRLRRRGVPSCVRAPWRAVQVGRVGAVPDLWSKEGPLQGPHMRSSASPTRPYLHPTSGRVGAPSMPWMTHSLFTELGSCRDFLKLCS